EPLRRARLARERTFPEQPPLWSRPTAPLRLTVARTAGPRMDPQRQDRFTQRAWAAFAPLHHLPRFLGWGSRDRLGVVACRRARFLGLPTWGGGRRGLGGRGLAHLSRQAHATVGGDRTDVEQSTLVQAAQEARNAIPGLSHHRRKGHLPVAGPIPQAQGQLGF